MAICKRCGKDHAKDLPADAMSVMHQTMRRLLETGKPAEVSPEETQGEWGVYYLADDMQPFEPVKGFRFTDPKDAAETAAKLSMIVGRPAWICKDEALQRSLAQAIRVFQGKPMDDPAGMEIAMDGGKVEIIPVPEKPEPIMPVMTAEEILDAMRAGAGHTTPRNRLN